MEMLSFKRKLPNILTTFRIAIIIPIFVILFIPELVNKKIYTIYINNNVELSTSLSFLIVLILFIIASITDFLDGFLARKWNVISQFGKIFDPIADKILVNIVMITISCNTNSILLPIVLLMVVRDIVVDAFRISAISKQIEIAANIWGKIKTFVQMIAIIFILIISTNSYSIISNIPNNWWYYGVQNLMFYIALFFSLFSAIIYIKKIYCELKK